MRLGIFVAFVLAAVLLGGGKSSRAMSPSLRASMAPPVPLVGGGSTGPTWGGPVLLGSVSGRPALSVGYTNTTGGLVVLFQCGVGELPPVPSGAPYSGTCAPISWNGVAWSLGSYTGWVADSVHLFPAGASTTLNCNCGRSSTQWNVFYRTYAP